MCTIGYHKELGIIFKNRDKQSRVTEELVARDDVLACRTMGADYFSWGMNGSGCGFVSAAINTPKWTRLVYEGRYEEADRKLIEENAGLQRPMRVISELLPEVRSIDEWIDALESSRDGYMGYNIVVADAEKSALVEVHGDNRSVCELVGRDVATNHFQMLRHGPKMPLEYASSFRRLEYGKRLIAQANTVTEVCEIMKPTDRQRQKEIWRKGTFMTISSSVLLLKQKKALYSTALESDYQCCFFE